MRTPSPPRARALLAVTAVLALVFLVYGRGLNGGFVFDDHHFVENNPAIRNLGNVLRFFYDPSTQSDHKGLNSDVYRPLATLSFALDYAAAGLTPAYYRTVNLLLHCCNVLLLMRLGGLLGISGPYAALLGAFFALFPTNVESFVWISGRSSVLSTAFILCALICFVRRVNEDDERLMLPAALWTTAALFTREISVTVPLLALAYTAACGLPLKKYLRGICAYLALPAVLFMLLRFLALGRFQQAPQPDMPPAVLAAVPFLIFAKYAEVLLYPFSMLVTYTDTMHARIAAMRFYLPFALAVLALYSVLAAALRAKGRKAAAWGLFWVPIALLPVLNIVSMTVYAAERLLYLPLAGMAIAVAALARELHARVRARRSVFAALCVLLVLFALNTQARMRVWRDDVSLWSYDVEKNPGNFLSRLRLADALRSAGDAAGAFSALAGALGTASNDRQRSMVSNEMGTLDAAAGNMKAAERLFLNAAGLDPGNHLAFYNLGKLNAMRGDAGAAGKYLDRSLRLNGDYAPARALADALRKQRGTD